MGKGLLKVSLQDTIAVPTSRKMTDSGMMIVPCAFARTGIQKYSAGQLGLADRDPSEIVEVHRKEDAVFDEDSMSSFRSAPVTLGHPEVQVTAENAGEYQVGMLEGMPVRDEDTLTGTLVLSNQKAIDALEEGVEELSAGYTCDLVVDEEGNICQTNIRANHIAIVSKGRAGSSCRIADEAEEGGDPSPELKDEAEEGNGEAKEVQLQDELDTAKAEVESLKVMLADSESAAQAIKDAHEELKAQFDAQAEQFQDELDARVKELSDVVTQARELTDIEDFTGMGAGDIKRAVVAAKYPKLDLEDKDDSYVNARYDILCEEGCRETPMGSLLADHLTKDNAPTKYEDQASKARKRMIERQTKKDKE
jgi:hypothetical protein